MAGWFDGLESGFSSRLQAMIEASGGRLSVVSGYRSVEEQTALWNGALAKYGSEDEARNWVAPPGSSNHNYGVAVDLGLETDDATDWAHANAARFGLQFPMDWEPWHIEPIGVREGNYPAASNSGPGSGAAPTDDGHAHATTGAAGTAEAYTNPPDGYTGATDATRRFDLGYQLTSLAGIMAGPVAGEDMLAGSGPIQATAAQPSTGITGTGR